MALIKDFEGFSPQYPDSVFLAENSSVIGDVQLGEDVSVWYGTVIRGDVGKVRVGARTNIQDLCCVHMTTDISSTIIGDDVSIGHSAIIHGARIDSGALIGMGCILMDNCTIGENSIVGAGSLVTSGTKIPPNSLAHGRPARVIRELTPGERNAGRDTANKYAALAQIHNRT